MAGNNSRLQRICRIYNEALNVVCSLLMVLILGAIFLQIFSRKILNDPLTWTEEFSRLAFIWMNCLGSAIVIKEKKHISFTVITDKVLNDKGRQYLEIGIDILLVIFFLFVLPSTFDLVRMNNNVPSAALQWHSGIFYLSFAVGARTMLIACVIDILEIVGIVKGGS